MWVDQCLEMDPCYGCQFIKKCENENSNFCYKSNKEIKLNLIQRD